MSGDGECGQEPESGKASLTSGDACGDLQEAKEMGTGRGRIKYEALTGECLWNSNVASHTGGKRAGGEKTEAGRPLRRSQVMWRSRGRRFSDLTRPSDSGSLG